MWTAPINSRLSVVVWSPTPFGLGQNGCWTSRGSQLPRALHFIFLLCCPLNDRRRTAHSFLKIGHLFSLSLFSCPSLACLCLLILLLLMSGGPIFPCSVRAGNVTCWGKSVKCCTCSKWVHLRYSELSLSKFRTLDSSHSWCCPPFCVPTRNTVTSSSDSSKMYTSTVQSRPSSTNAALSPHPCLQTSYPLSAHSVSSPSAPSPPSLAAGCPSKPPLSSLTLSGFSNPMLEAFESEALNYSTFFRPILLTLSVSRNPILTHLPLSGFLVSLRSDRIHSQSGILALDATHTSSSVIISVRQGLYFSELATSSPLLDPYDDYVKVNISLNNNSLLSFLNVYAPLFAPLRWTAEPTPFFPPFFPPSEISSFWRTSIAIIPSETQEVLPTPWGGSI